jgi:uncharacterized protein with HEPN domain
MTPSHVGTSTHDDSLPMRRMLASMREAASMVNGRSRTDLDNDRMIQLALACLIGMVGNVATRVGSDKRTLHPDIPWDEIIATGNRMIREYDTIDYDKVWRIVTEEFPVLSAALERALPGHVS